MKFSKNTVERVAVIQSLTGGVCFLASTIAVASIVSGWVLVPIAFGLITIAGIICIPEEEQ